MYRYFRYIGAKNLDLIACTPARHRPFFPQTLMGGQQRDTREDLWVRPLSLVGISSSSVPEKLCICRPPLLFQRNQINSLRNGREYDLKQIENAFRDPEDGFWGGNSSESSEVY